MRLTFFIIISLFLLKNAAGQDSVRVTRVFENNEPITAIDSLYHQMHNTIWVSFDEGLKDSIYVTVNGYTFFNKHIETNESIGYADGFGLGFEDSTKAMIIKIKFVKANFYIQERVNVKYKSLRLGHYKRGWQLLYENSFPMRE